jgi:hypothetical protein
MMPCRWAKVYRYFGEMYCPHFLETSKKPAASNPEDDSSILLANICKLLLEHMVTHPTSDQC